MRKAWTYIKCAFGYHADPVHVGGYWRGVCTAAEVLCPIMHCRFCEETWV